MEKVLRLYTYINGYNDSPFPSADSQIEIFDFKYDAKRMGGAPTITAVVMHPTCLDDLWTKKVYATFNGENYYLKQTPTSSYSNEDDRYKHNLELISERVILDNVYFYDAVVGSPQGADKPVSNSTKFVFSGTIFEFAARLNASLNYRGLGNINTRSGYYVVVDATIEDAETKLVSFEDTFFSNAIQEIYNTYNLPYYFSGKVIHIGYSGQLVPTTFEYGVDGALLSVTKNNANYKVVNRATGVGSSDNIPFYYPNNSPKGDIEAQCSNANLGVVIENMGTYSNKVKLDEVLRYVKASNTTNKVFQHTSYAVPSEIDTANSGLYEELILTHDTTYTFSAHSEAFDRNGERYRGGINYLGYKVSIYRSGFWLVEMPINQGGEYDFHLSAGSYHIKCQSMFSFYEVPDYEDMDDIITIITTVTVRASTPDAYWEKDGKKLSSLSKVGLKITNGTPTAGDTITQRLIKYVNTSNVLLPSIYRSTDAKERFYDAVNGGYTIEGYHIDYGDTIFNNPFLGNNPCEHIVKMEDIKPTIKEKEVNGVRIDKFVDVAFDTDDDNETYEDDNGNTNYKHPYFFVKLHRMDFNLFDHAIEQQPMVIAMTSGDCGSCQFEIAVDEETQKNTVQVDSNGNLLRDAEGRVLCGVKGLQDAIYEFQDRQQDTINNEVWIALRKEESTYGIIMPYAPKIEGGNFIEVGHRPTNNDTFVILGINLPLSYVLSAEKRLEQEVIKYIKENNDEKFTFEISFSRIYLEENPDIFNALNENSEVVVAYNNKTYNLFVSSFSYDMNGESPLPSIKVTLDENLSITKNALQNAISQVKTDIGNIIVSSPLAQYVYMADKPLMASTPSTTVVTPYDFKKGISFGEGGKVEILDNNSAKLTIEYLEVTKKATFNSLEIQQKEHIGGQLIVTPAAIICGEVDNYGSYYRCFFQTRGEKGEEIFNQFKVGDQAICQTYNTWGSKYYWRLVVGVGDDYIDLSKNDCDLGSDIPSVGDRIIQLGNRNNIERQNAIVLTAAGKGSPNLIQYTGINSYEISDDNIATRLSPYGNLLVGQVVMKANSVFTKQDGSVTSLSEYLFNMQNQVDGSISTWFYNDVPTLYNLPASEWDSEEEMIRHLGDLYYSGEGRAYRFQRDGFTLAFSWVEIVDNDITKALQQAKEAQDTADGKRTIFVEQPMPPYQVGDLWVNATISAGNISYNNDILRCKKDREFGETFSLSDWELASGYGNDISQLRDDVNGAIRDGIIDETERRMLQDTIKSIETTIAQVEESYGVFHITMGDNATIDSAMTMFRTKATALVEKISELLDSTTIMTNEARDDFYNSFNATFDDFNNAYSSIIQALQQATSDRISSFDYLKGALKERTVVEGGLIQTSALMLGYTQDNNYRVMAGSTGMYNHSKTSGGIASWWGGEMVDAQEYYRIENGEKVQTNPLPNGLEGKEAKAAIRFDGSGYFADGNLWWDKDGNLNGNATSLMFGNQSMQSIIDNANAASQVGNFTIPRYSMWMPNTLYLDGNNDSKIKDYVNIVINGQVLVFECVIEHISGSTFERSNWGDNTIPYAPMIATDLFLAKNSEIHNLWVRELKTEKDVYNQISIEKNKIKVNDSLGDTKLYIHGDELTTNTQSATYYISSSSLSKSNLNANTNPKSETITTNISTINLSNKGVVVFPSIRIDTNHQIYPSTNLSGSGSISQSTPIQLENLTLTIAIMLDNETIATSGGFSVDCPSFTRTLSQGTHYLRAVYQYSFYIREGGNGSCSFSASTSGGTASLMTSAAMTEIAKNGFRTMWGNDKRFEVKKNSNDSIDIIMQNGNTTMSVTTNGVTISNSLSINGANVVTSPTIKSVVVVPANNSYPTPADANTIYVKLKS